MGSHVPAVSRLKWAYRQCVWRHPRDTLTCLGLWTGIHTQALHIQSHTHFCKHNSRNTYVHQYQHKMNLCEDRSCQHKTYTNTHAFSNRVRHGIRDFRKDKFPRRTAMDYGWYSQCFEQWKYSLLMNVEHLCYK